MSCIRARFITAESIMAAKQYQVILDLTQRDYLLTLISSGKESARKLRAVPGSS